MQLQGKIAFVTGGGKRLGRAIAVALAEGGADILLHVHTSSGEDTARAIEALGRRAIILRADISMTAAAVRLGRDAMATAGRVDILINNAAVFFPTPVTTLTTKSWKSVIQTNLTSPFILALLFGRAMRAQGAGKIVQLGDWGGIRPTLGYLPYCVSKGGIQVMTQALAKAFAPDVQVTTVAPGPVLPPEQYDAIKIQHLVEQTPLQRLGSEQDVVRAVRFLVESGDFVTGATYFVDGGWLAKVASGSVIS
ncbi:MAG: SDR family NAD(P)-dependent oxidoreductase [Candidatus Binatia bacterium]